MKLTTKVPDSTKLGAGTEPMKTTDKAPPARTLIYTTICAGEGDNHRAESGNDG